MGIIAIFICIVTVILTGAFLVGIALKLINISIEIPLLQKSILANQIIDDYTLRLIIGLCGISIVFLCLRYLYSLVFPPQRSKTVSFETAQGKISITIFAIEDMIKKLLEQRKELAHVRPRVIFRKKFIDVVVSSYLTYDVNLLEFTQEIQQEIKKKLVGFLGTNNDVRVKISIRKVTFSKKDRESIDAADREPDIPFRSY